MSDTEPRENPENNDTGPEKPEMNGVQPPGTPQQQQPKPPMRMFIFWLVILFALPVTLYFFNQKKEQEKVSLTSSEFEEYLTSGQVKSTVIVKNSSGSIKRISGEYLPPGTVVPETDSEKLHLRSFDVDIVYSDKVDELIRIHSPERKVERESDLFGSLLISILPVLILVFVIYFLFSRQIRSAGRGAMQFGKSRAKLMSVTQEKVTFKDIAGIDEAKEEVEEIVEFLRDTQKFQQLGGKIPKGVLMVGPPGTGKTLLARAIAGEAEVPFFSISGSDFVEMFVGVGASRVRDMFEEGKKNAPCIIFIDEIDAVGRSRFSGIGGGHDEREQTLNALLVEMDGFQSNSGIIVVAATNRPDVLDPALLRPGRFDRQITIDLPDVKGRHGILKLHARNIKLADNVDLHIIARGTPGFSGADLANLINESALLAARNGSKAVTLDFLEEARDKVRWGRERRSRVFDEKDRRITAFHEAGHALIGLICEHATPLHKVTIVPRGNAYLGATMSLPEKERYTCSRAELHDELAVLMGGRIAEELIFSEITTGASMDIRQASNIANKMVCHWGMSDILGPLSYGNREEHIYLGRDITRTESYSEATAREIDNEVRRIVRDAEKRTREILTENIDKLKLLGETLLEKETMAAEEVRELLGFPPKEKAEDSTGEPQHATEATAAAEAENNHIPKAEKTETYEAAAEAEPDADARK